jgi:response regulator RpfG family c-di-GMP phosphodiesterase
MDFKYTILCVDDEENILSSLKRVFRGENYTILTATGSVDGLKLLEENEVHLVMSDQRMPGMSGTEFLAAVKDLFPQVVRIILSGYTDVDVLTEAINRGHIYKLLLKPWNDQTLKLEVKRALEYYELKHANKLLNEKILEHNNELKSVNEKLERMVKIRTEELEIQNQVLEHSRAILDYIPIPIIGISSEKNIVYLNRKAESISFAGRNITIGYEVSDYFKDSLTKIVDESMRNEEAQYVKDYLIGEDTYDIDFTPLSGNFSGRGIILSLKLKTDK